MSATRLGICCSVVMLLGGVNSRAQDEALEPAVDTSATVTDAATPPTASNEITEPVENKTVARENTAAAADRLELEATQVTGNRELPSVLYIVPWKRADLGDAAGKPLNSLLDEVLEPVDREVLQRQTRYFQALQDDSADAAAAAPAK
jgi:hypothetical protein